MEVIYNKDQISRELRNILAHYYLFLDECTPTAQMHYFVLGGCIIDHDNYQNVVIPHINALKNEIWGNENIILHEYEIRQAVDQYKVLRQPAKRELFWLGMRRSFSMDCIHTIGVAINCDEYSKVYNSTSRNDEYLVALHLILENFMHFLEVKGGTGSVFVESRNKAEDIKLGNLYHTIKATGTLFFERNIYQEKLGKIEFPTKADNNIGLQLADFVPNPISRGSQGKALKLPTIYPEINSRLYCGSLAMQNRFGLKMIP